MLEYSINKTLFLARKIKEKGSSKLEEDSHMDFRYSNIKLHEEATTILFRHYRTFTKIFQDILGLLEIDYMSITLITSENKLLFLSSKPSIETNLIEKNLWQFDGSYHPDFFLKNEIKKWSDLYHQEWRKALSHFKQEVPKLYTGYSVPSYHHNLRLVYSCATKSSHPTSMSRIIDDPEILIRIGKFCLQNINKILPIHTLQKTSFEYKPSLKLIVNNE